MQISVIGYCTVEMPARGLSGICTVQLKPNVAVLESAVVSFSLPKTEIKGDAMVTNITGSVLEHRQSEKLLFLTFGDKKYLEIPEGSEVNQRVNLKELFRK